MVYVRFDQRRRMIYNSFRRFIYGVVFFSFSPATADEVKSENSFDEVVRYIYMCVCVRNRIGRAPYYYITLVSCTGPYGSVCRHRKTRPRNGARRSNEAKIYARVTTTTAGTNNYPRKLFVARARGTTELCRSSAERDGAGDILSPTVEIAYVAYFAISPYPLSAATNLFVRKYDRGPDVVKKNTKLSPDRRRIYVLARPLVKTTKAKITIYGSRRIAIKLRKYR